MDSKNSLKTQKSGECKKCHYYAEIDISRLCVLCCHHDGPECSSCHSIATLYPGNLCFRCYYYHI